MDSADYHKQCSFPKIFSQKELEDTIKALEKVGSTKVQLVVSELASTPIEKPKQHIGGKDTDYFHVAVSIHDAEVIIEEFGNFEVGSVSLEGNTTPLASHYAQLLNRWLNYVEVA